MDRNLFRKFWRTATGILFLASVVFGGALLPSRSSHAIPCGVAPGVDGCGEATIIQQYHSIFEDRLMQDISNTFAEYREWLVTTFFRNQVLPALMLFTEQMSAVAMHQAMTIGMFLDAKHQLETQRLFEELQTQAHKDYHPSEDFCWFGTNVRSLAAAEQQGRFNAVALDSIQLGRQLGNANMASAGTRDIEKAHRWKQFVQTYCDPRDNNWIQATPGTGLRLACGQDNPANPARVNIDIDYTRAIDEPRTLDVNFASGTAASAGEKDIVALASNLYGHEVLTRPEAGDYLKQEQFQHFYLALRSVAAKRSVAQNSFNAIVGLKSAGSANQSGASSTSRFLGAILTELGVPAGEVYQIIGNDPSYYAQLEILAKKIYQNPDFYSNLYDKPANVARKGVALKAVDLMLDRAIFESQIRQEMATSVLLSSRLRQAVRTTNRNLATTGGE